MLYFDTLPKLLTTDELGYPILLTNILTRAKLVEELQNNPMLFYEYAIQDGDTPEIIAFKYYGDPYKYWIILYSNQILDPIWEWPILDEQQFLNYLDNKYASDAQAAGKTPFEYVNTTVYSYYKVITTTNLNTDQIDIKKITVDLATYNSITPSVNTYDIKDQFNSVYNAKIEIGKSISYIIDYEREQNEKRRTIKILNESYSYRMEEQLKYVMER
jgi:hypothetical protein